MKQIIITKIPVNALPFVSMSWEFLVWYIHRDPTKLPSYLYLISLRATLAVRPHLSCKSPPHPPRVACCQTKDSHDWKWQTIIQPTFTECRFVLLEKKAGWRWPARLARCLAPLSRSEKTRLALAGETGEVTVWGVIIWSAESISTQFLHYYQSISTISAYEHQRKVDHERMGHRANGRQKATAPVCRHCHHDNHYIIIIFFGDSFFLAPGHFWFHCR